MVENDYLPLAEKRLQVASLLTHTLTVRTIGVPEEELFLRRYPDLWQQLSQWGKLSSLPEFLGVTISLNIEGMSQNELDKKVNEARQFLQNHPLAPAIWAWEQGPLENILVELAKKKKLRLSCAESCSGGLIQSKLTSVAGCSEIFPGGFVSYSEETKENLLGVDPKIFRSSGVISEACAMSMAKGAREKTKADIAISTTGVAGPAACPIGENSENPVGTVWIGVSTQTKNYGQKFLFRGNRLDLQERFARQALHVLLAEVKNWQ